MSEEIRPAFEAWEWEAIYEGGGPDPHKQMALGNASLPDGDPRKLTREDVEAIRYVCTLAVSWVPQHDSDDARQGAIARAAASKIASLLPPEEGR